MFAELSVSAPTATIPVSLIVMLGVAVTALVSIGVVVRRMRSHGTLNLSNASTSAAAAAFVLAAALLGSVSIGTPEPAAAAPQSPTVVSPTNDGYQPIPIEGLEGYQLPTK